MLTIGDRADYISDLAGTVPAHPEDHDEGRLSWWSDDDADDGSKYTRTMPATHGDADGGDVATVAGDEHPDVSMPKDMSTTRPITPPSYRQRHPVTRNQHSGSHQYAGHGYWPARTVPPCRLCPTQPRVTPRCTDCGYYPTAYCRLEWCPGCERTVCMVCAYSLMHSH